MSRQYLVTGHDILFSVIKQDSFLACTELHHLDQNNVKLILIQVVDDYTMWMWMWMVLPVFQTYILPPSSGLKYV
jgi:hypothetical protein